MSAAIKPLGASATYRGLAFLLSGLPLGLAWLTLLSSAWATALGVAITPLVVPAVIVLVLVVRAGAVCETALARWLLDVDLAVPRWPSREGGVWRYVRATLSDRALWRAQGYLVLRAVLGVAIATALLAAIGAALALIAAPILYAAVPHGFDIGDRHVHSILEALVCVPIGLLLLLVTAHLVGPLCAPWGRLSATMLGAVAQRPVSAAGEGADTLELNGRGLRVHALTFAGVNLLFVLLWAVTSGGYFWPVWTILVFAAPLALHAWIVWVGRHRAVWPRWRLTPAFAVHAGVWTVFLLFLCSVWAVTSRGYFWPVWVFLAGAIPLGAHAAVLLLRSPEQRALSERISVLESSRAGAVDVQEAELRRIERDLHDGAQARLVALGMSLGMAEQKLASDADAARELLAEARAGAGEALRELRDLARGIHPPVLADRGLEAAIRALAAASPTMVTVSVLLPKRPKAPVESAAYFVVAESLANAGKHAQATRMQVRVQRSGDNLSVEIEDDGIGGADPHGGGLSGLRRRVEALDGTLAVHSPQGGPTTVRAELPCGS